MYQRPLWQHGRMEPHHAGSDRIVIQRPLSSTDACCAPLRMNGASTGLPPVRSVPFTAWQVICPDICALGGRPEVVFWLQDVRCIKAGQGDVYEWVGHCLECELRAAPPTELAHALRCAVVLLRLAFGELKAFLLEHSCGLSVKI